MGLFAKRVADAAPSQGASYWKDGSYLVQINQVFMKESRKGDELFIVTGTALKSTNEKIRVGSERSWVVLTKWDSAPGNIKSFIAAAMDVEHDDVEEDGIEAVISAANPLNGRVVELEVETVETKNGGDFSQHRWKPVSEEMQEQASTIREAAGLPPF